MASIKRRADGAYRIWVYAGDGKRLTRVVHGGRDAAKEAVRQLEDQVRAHPRTGAEMTIDDLFTRYLEHITVNGRSSDYVAGARQQYDRILAPAVGSKRVTALRTMHIDDLWASLSPSHAPSSIHRYHALLSGALRQAQRWQLIVRNPADDATKPPMRRRGQRPPDGGEVARALDTARRLGPTVGLMVRLAAATGCRRGELSALSWDAVDLDAGQVDIARSRSCRTQQLKTTKTFSGVRTMTVDAGTVAALRAELERQQASAERYGFPWEPTFPVIASGRPGRPPKVDTLSHWWARVRTDAGLPETVRLHDLRHFSITQLLDAGVPVAAVAERHGHASKTTTLNIYASATRRADQQSADVMGAVLDG